ncbi:MAG: hypothetical protein ACOYNI_04990 [Acidimicrobiia bacterium]
MAEPFWQRWWTYHTYYRDEARARRRGDFDAALDILLEHANRRHWSNALAMSHNVIGSYAATGRPDLVEPILAMMAERVGEADTDHARTWGRAITLQTAWQIDPALLAVTEARLGMEVPAPPKHFEPTVAQTPERLQFLFTLVADPGARTEELLTELRDQIVELASSGAELARTALDLATERFATLESEGRHLAAATVADIAAIAHRIVHPGDDSVAARWADRANSLRKLVTDGPDFGPRLALG